MKVTFNYDKKQKKKKKISDVQSRERGHAGAYKGRALAGQMRAVAIKYRAEQGEGKGAMKSKTGRVGQLQRIVGSVQEQERRAGG